MACASEVLIISAKYGGADLNHPVAYNIVETVTRIPIPNPGKLGPGCRVGVAADLVCTVEFIERPLVDIYHEPAGLEIITKDGDGTEVTKSMDNMVVVSTGVVHNDRSPARYQVTFAIQDDMDSDQLGIA
jgi:hypothetical protein